MNMIIEDQRAVKAAAGPAGSPRATFGPEPQACHPGVMPLPDGASQFNLLKPVKGCSSQFADKVHCLAPREVQPVAVPDTSSPAQRTKRAARKKEILININFCGQTIVWVVYAVTLGGS